MMRAGDRKQGINKCWPNAKVIVITETECYTFRAIGINQNTTRYNFYLHMWLIFACLVTYGIQ